MEQTTESEFKVSKYNAAFDQIQRVGGLWRIANSAAARKNYEAWNTFLDIIWRELAGDLKAGSKEELEYNQYIEKVAKLLPLKNPTNHSFNKPTEELKMKESSQYKILNDKEVFLRRLQNNLGKGTAYRDEWEDDFE